MTPFQQILQVTLNNVQKLLIDYRIGQNDNSKYAGSQFEHIYGDEAYDSDGQRRPYTDETDDGSGHFYPLSMQETLELHEIRIIDYIQLGFIPIDDIDTIEAPSLYIANATDRQRVEPGDTTLQQVEEVIPLNFRLMLKQPEQYKIDDTNIVVVDKVLEGLKYVLNPDDYINLTFERRGYDIPTVIRKIEFVQALNLEEFLSPYEVVDYLFQITLREQRSRSKLMTT